MHAQLTAVIKKQPLELCLLVMGNMNSLVYKAKWEYQMLSDKVSCNSAPICAKYDKVWSIYDVGNTDDEGTPLQSVAYFPSQLSCLTLAVKVELSWLSTRSATQKLTV